MNQNVQIALHRGFAGIAWLALIFFSWLILRNSFPYFGGLVEFSGIPFVLDKGTLVGNGVWRTVLIIHVAAGAVCLFATLLQFFRPVLRKWPRVHRYLGRVYAFDVLAVLCPTGFYLGFFAKGGLAGQGGFLILGILTFCATWRGYREMRRGKNRSHARWMIRSFALVTTAITFRIYNLALFATGMNGDTVYVVALWLSLIGNAAAAEILISRIFPNPSRTRTQTRTFPKNEKPNPENNRRPVVYRRPLLRRSVAGRR